MSLERVLFVAAFFFGSAAVFLAVEAYETVKAARAFVNAQAIADTLEELGEPRLTVMWRTNTAVDRAMTGRVEWVDREVVTIDDGYEFVVVKRSDILAMF